MRTTAYYYNVQVIFGVVVKCSILMPFQGICKGKNVVWAFCKF